MKEVKRVFVGYSRDRAPWMDALLKNTVVASEVSEVTNPTDKRRKAAEAKDVPYLGFFNEVCLATLPLDATHVVSFKLDPNNPQQLIQDVVRTLVAWCPDVWDNNPVDTDRGKATIIGFNPRLFLKMLGLSSAALRQSVGRPPLTLWYNNTDHRDLEEAFLPSECKNLSWATVFAVIRLHMTVDDAAKFGKLIAGWTGPGVNPYQDLQLAITLGDAIGLGG